MDDEETALAGEDPVAAIRVAADPELLPAVADFVSRVAGHLGAGDDSGRRLGRAAEAVCRSLIRRGFEGDGTGQYDVHVLRRPGQVVVSVEDRGLPFDYAALEDGCGTPVSEMLRPPFADEIRFLNLGRRGNRVELVRHLTGADVRGDLAGHGGITRDPAAPGDVRLTIRMMRPEESIELARCVYRSYGYSYDWDDVYYPERIRELQERGVMRSCVAVTPAGDLVAHIALTVHRPGSPVGELGQAVVDPRFRGHHLFERMKTFLAERAKDWGMLGLYSEATAVHPYSQMGNLHLGARETGYLLGYIPGTVSYRGIGDERGRRRGSVALFYLRVAAEPQRAAYPPAAYRDLSRRVIDHCGLRRTVHDGAESEMPPSSRIHMTLRRDHNLAVLTVEEPGGDLCALVRPRLRGLCLDRVDCIYVDLPLSSPATARAAAGLEDLGFFFGGIIPEASDGAVAGDVLRLQYLNNVDVEDADVRTASDFGKDLLESIVQQQQRTRQAPRPA